MKIIEGSIDRAIGEYIVDLNGVKFDLGDVSYKKEISYKRMLAKHIGKDANNISPVDGMELQIQAAEFFITEIMDNNPTSDREKVSKLINNNINKLMQEANIAFGIASKEDIEKAKDKEKKD